MIRNFLSAAFSIVALLAVPAAAQQITTMPQANLPLSGAEMTYIVQNGTSKQTTVGNLISPFSGQFLPISGGVLTGPVTMVGGTMTGTYAGAHTNSGPVTFSAGGTGLTVNANASFGATINATGGQINLGTAGGGGGGITTATTGGGAFNFTLSGSGAFTWRNSALTSLMTLATSKLQVNVPIQSANTYVATGLGPGSNYTLAGSGSIALIGATTNYTGAYTGTDGIVSITNATDDIAVTGQGGFAATSLRVNRQFGGAATNGGRSAAVFALTQTIAVPRNTTGGQYITLGAFNSALANAGGTGLSGGQQGGANYAFYPQTILWPGATNFLIASLMEGDIGIAPSTQPLTITGAIAAGDTFSTTFTSADVAGSPLTLTVTAGTGDTATSIVNKLMAAMQASSALQAAGIGGMQTTTQQLTVQSKVQGAALTVAASTSGSAVLTLGSVVIGASATNRIGITVSRAGNDGAQGDTTDIGLQFGAIPTASTASGFRMGILFGAAAMSPTGTLIGAANQNIFAQSVSAPFMPTRTKYGIDWSLINFTQASGLSIKVPGIGLAAGVIDLQNATIATTSAGIVIDVPGGRIGSGNPAIVSGGGGGAGQDQNKYFAGIDIVQDANGGQYLVDAVDNSTGAVTHLTTLVQPSTSTASLGVAIATTGGSGTGLTITPTGVANNALSLMPSGGPTTIGGTLAVTGAITGTAATQAVDTNTTALATTAFVLGQASSTLPLIDGTATIGTSTRYSREDHKHPTDTTRAALTGAVFSGAVSLGNNTTTQQLRINGPAGVNRVAVWQTAGVVRWQAYANGTAEGGANAGSDWQLTAFDDSGTNLSTPISITRSTGLITAGSITVTGTLTSASYKSGAAVGVSCAANSVTLLTEVVTNGIVTHC